MGARLFNSGGAEDPAVNLDNLAKDLDRLEGAAGSKTGVYVKALTTGETSNVTNRINYYTAGGTIAAQTFNLPAAPNDGDELTVLTQAVTTAATFGVASPGTATIVGAPTATAAGVPITFKFDKTQNKYYRIG